MGYTHYWNLDRVPNNYKEQTTKAFIEIQSLLERMPSNSETAGGHYNEHKVVLRGGIGEGEPIITNEKIWFNGDARKHLDHETFGVEFNGKPFNDFCKTARKPYDLAVCLCLLSLANHIEGFEFSSDGDKDDWEPAINFYQERNGEYVSDNLKRNLSKFGV